MISKVAVIDNGYYSTVALQQDPSIVPYFRSKVQKVSSPINTHNTHHLMYRGTLYLVGEGAENIDINLNKSNSELHFLTTLTALGLMSTEESNFRIISNCPLNLYNKRNKEELEDALRSKQKIGFILNNKAKNVSVLDCLVFPQSLPALYVNSAKSSITAILDIGGMTAQGCITQNKNIVQSSVFTENLGTLVLMNSIKKALNSKYNINLQDYQLEDTIKNGLTQDKTGSIKIIQEICTEHTEKILQAARLTGWNLENIEVMLTGGGSLLLEEFLSKALPNYFVSSNPVYDNVKGLWEVAKYYYKF